jgi:hypothetical protein
MTQEEKDRTKKIAELRGLLEKRVETIETELEGLRLLLSFVDEMLLANGFKRATIGKPVSASPKIPSAVQPTESKRSIPLKTVTGDLLAEIYDYDDSLRLVLAKDKDFSVRTPPFSSFLVERVLKKMQEKDRDATRAGDIPPDKVLTYNVSQEGDLIREITIKNITSARFQEFKSAARWTLEKMYEKMLQAE